MDGRQWQGVILSLGGSENLMGRLAILSMVLLLGMGPAHAEDYRFVAGQVEVLARWCGYQLDAIWLDQTFSGQAEFDRGQTQMRKQADIADAVRTPCGKIKRIIEQIKDIEKRSSPTGGSTGASDSVICNFAITTKDGTVSWESRADWLGYVNEAKRRDLTPPNCAKIIGWKSTGLKEAPAQEPKITPPPSSTTSSGEVQSATLSLDRFDGKWTGSAKSSSPTRCGNMLMVKMSIHNGSVRGKVTSTGWNRTLTEILGNISGDGRIEIRNRDLVLEGIFSAEAESGEGVVNMLAKGCKGPFKVTKTFMP